MKDSHNMKTDNRSVEMFWNNFNKSNSRQEEIKIRLQSGNASYHSVQNLLSFRLLFCMGVKLGRSH